MRAAKHAWKIQRGERVEEANATKAIYALLEGIGEREAKEVDRLAPLIDKDGAAVRQLRTFLGGIDYLLQAWSIFDARLSLRRNLLFSQRQRCFRLLGTSWRSVLRSEPVATRLLRAQIGVLCGPKPTLEQVAGFVGSRPPEGMSQAEFHIRIKELAESLLPQAEALDELAKIVKEAMAELKTVRQEVQEQTERHLELDTISAQMESTPEGTRLANRIDKSERGLMAALRRVQLLQQPEPKRGRKTSGASAPTAAASPPAEPEETGSPEPDAVAVHVDLTLPTDGLADDPNTPLSTTVDADEPATKFPAVVTAEVDATFTAEGLIESREQDPLTTIEAAPPSAKDDAGLPTSEVDANLCSFKPIFEPTSEVDANLCSFKPIFEPTSEVDANLCSFKPISSRRPTSMRISAHSNPFPSRRRGRRNLCSFKPIYSPALVNDAEPFAPEAAEATRDGPVAQPRRDRSRMAIVGRVPWRRRLRSGSAGLTEQSRQLDAHFGVNTERPDPIDQTEASDRAFESGRGDRDDSS